MTVVCIACEGQGTHERLARPDEVDAGCELGIAHDECELCKGRGVVFEEPVVYDEVQRWTPEERDAKWKALEGDREAVYERISLAPNGTEVRETWDRRPDGSYCRKVEGLPAKEPATLLGVADHDSFEAQAEMGQGPPA